MGLQSTHRPVEVHDPSSLGVNGRSILVARDQVHSQHPVTMVDLGPHQLLQLFQLVLRPGMGGTERAASGTNYDTPLNPSAIIVA